MKEETLKEAKELNRKIEQYRTILNIKEQLASYREHILHDMPVRLFLERMLGWHADIPDELLDFIIDFSSKRIKELKEEFEKL